MKKTRIITILALVLTLLLVMTACGGKDDKDVGSDTKGSGNTQTAPGVPGTINEDFKYTAEDGSYEIVLPDSSWTLNSDATDGMVMFNSGIDIISIMMLDADDIKDSGGVNVMPMTKDEFQKQLTAQGATNMELISYENKVYDSLDSYKAITKISGEGGQVSYAVTVGVLWNDAGVNVGGTALSGNEADLQKIEDAVDSFKILS